MINIGQHEVAGFEHALRGMRNPMDSWDKSDSFYTQIEDEETLEVANYEFFIGENDHKLASDLSKAGRDHSKYRRMIVVWVDITAPLYWWKEFDTYKVGTVANSCSTMHTIHRRPFNVDDFSHDHMNANQEKFLKTIIDQLNEYQKSYISSLDRFWWWQIIQTLPSSYNQKRTVMLNYEVLANIYNSRRNHKLDEWQEFCNWIESLPYSDLITGKEA